MTKYEKILSAIVLVNACMTGWVVLNYKNAPPVEESVRVRVTQSDRFIAENTNNIVELKQEVMRLKAEDENLKNMISQQAAQLRMHDEFLKRIKVK